MRIVQINIVHNGSTGKIMLQIAKTAQERGHETRTYSPLVFSKGPKQSPPEIQRHATWGTLHEMRVHYYMGTVFGANGLFSSRGTKQLIEELEKFQPDVLHLHNLHRFCLDLPQLFRYIKRSGVKVVFTLHDCWAFTGHCPHFEMVACDKWKTECKNCPQPRIYPKMYLDTSRWMHRLKKKWLSGIKNMTLVTPSAWLASLVKQSFLKDYPIRVINNGIDLQTFRPTESNFRQKYDCVSKKLVLGVAFDWGPRKGLDMFIKLAEQLDDSYQIVLVGTNDAVDQQLPQKIISIHKTDNQIELAKIYTAADVFVNPTREDNYPTVNMEALACGTPVLTFRTGGSPEMLDSTCGVVVEKDDFDALEREVRRICCDLPYTAEACLARALSFDMNDKFKEYLDLYEHIAKC